MGRYTVTTLGCTQKLNKEVKNQFAERFSGQNSVLLPFSWWDLWIPLKLLFSLSGRYVIVVTFSVYDRKVMSHEFCGK